MKRFKKWLVGLVVIMLVAAVLVTLFVRFVLFSSFDADLTRYADKADVLTKPELYVLTAEEPEKVNALTRLRAMLSNSKLDGDLGAICNFSVDVACAFLVENEESDLQEGCFINVCRGKTDQDVDPDSCIGVISVDKLCEYDFAEELYSVLDKNHGCYVKMPTYAECDYLIVPIDIVVEDMAGNIIASYTNDNVPDGYVVNTSDETYIVNFDGDNIVTASDDSLYQKMSAAYDSDCEAQVLCKELKTGINFANGDGTTTSETYGIGIITKSYVRVAGDKAMVRVIRMNFEDAIITDMIIAGCVWSLLYVIILLVKKKRTR